MHADRIAFQHLQHHQHTRPEVCLALVLNQRDGSDGIECHCQGVALSYSLSEHDGLAINEEA